jgi:hypothetical protein
MLHHSHSFDAHGDEAGMRAGLRDETLGVPLSARKAFFAPNASTHQHARGYEGISIYWQASPLNLG